MICCYCWRCVFFSTFSSHQILDVWSFAFVWNYMCMAYHEFEISSEEKWNGKNKQKFATKCTCVVGFIFLCSSVQYVYNFLVYFWNIQTFWINSPFLSSNPLQPFSKPQQIKHELILIWFFFSFDQLIFCQQKSIQISANAKCMNSKNVFDLGVRWFGYLHNFRFNDKKWMK